MGVVVWWHTNLGRRCRRRPSSTSGLGSLFQLLRLHPLDQESFNAIILVPLLVLLQSGSGCNVLVGFEPGLRLMVKMAFGGNVCQQVRHIGEARCLGADGAEQRYLLGSRAGRTAPRRGQRRHVLHETGSAILSTGGQDVGSTELRLEFGLTGCNIARRGVERSQQDPRRPGDRKAATGRNREHSTADQTREAKKRLGEAGLGKEQLVWRDGQQRRTAQGSLQGQETDGSDDVLTVGDGSKRRRVRRGWRCQAGSRDARRRRGPRHLRGPEAATSPSLLRCVSSWLREQRRLNTSHRDRKSVV